MSVISDAIAEMEDIKKIKKIKKEKKKNRELELTKDMVKDVVNLFRSGKSAAEIKKEFFVLDKKAKLTLTRAQIAGIRKEWLKKLAEVESGSTSF